MNRSFTSGRVKHYQSEEAAAGRGDWNRRTEGGLRRLKAAGSGAPAPPAETAAFTRRWFAARVFLSD